MESTKILLWIIAYFALFIFSLFLAIHIREKYLLWKIARFIKWMQKKEHDIDTGKLLNELSKTIEKERKDHSIFKSNNEDK